MCRRRQPGERWTLEERQARASFDAFQRSLNYPATVPGFVGAWRAMTGGRMPPTEAVNFFRAQVQQMLDEAAIDNWDVEADTTERWSMNPPQATDRAGW